MELHRRVLELAVALQRLGQLQLWFHPDPRVSRAELHIPSRVPHTHSFRQPDCWRCMACCVSCDSSVRGRRHRNVPVNGGDLHATQRSLAHYASDGHIPLHHGLYNSQLFGSGVFLLNHCCVVLLQEKKTSGLDSARGPCQHNQNLRHHDPAPRISEHVESEEDQPILLHHPNRHVGSLGILLPHHGRERLGVANG